MILDTYLKLALSGKTQLKLKKRKTFVLFIFLSKDLYLLIQLVKYSIVLKSLVNQMILDLFLTDSRTEKLLPSLLL